MKFNSEITEKVKECQNYNVKTLNDMQCDADFTSIKIYNFRMKKSRWKTRIFMS